MITIDEEIEKYTVLHERLHPCLMVFGKSKFASGANLFFKLF